MNKMDLINAVAEVMESKAQAKTAVDKIFSAITGALKKGDAVAVAGFGTFKVQKRAARTGRNPQTGEALKIKAKKVPKFLPGKTLKESVN